MQYFMESYDKWFGNLTLEDDGEIPNYMDKNPFAFMIYTKGILRTQQVRSYQLSLANKLDIWDSKNYFRNSVREIIEKENLSFCTYDHLIDKVLDQVKNLVKKEKPKNIHDVPWRYYTRKVLEQANLNTKRRASIAIRSSTVDNINLITE